MSIRTERTGTMNEWTTSNITIIFLTFNSEKTIRKSIEAALLISDDIYIIDSFSVDMTIDICKHLGVNILQHEFSNYSSQRNWAIDMVPAPGGWQLHLDADEELTPDLVQEINEIDLAHTEIDGFMIRRRIAFMGKELRWGGLATTWHYRLFRNGMGRCEDRLYDQHFLPRGRVGYMRSCLIDHNIETLTEWTNRHNRWATMEAEEFTRRQKRNADVLEPRALGTPTQRKRYLKTNYYSLPLFWRAGAYFIYRLFFHAAFLDGYRGVIFCVLQSLWFRFLVDAKIYEYTHSKHQ